MKLLTIILNWRTPDMTLDSVEATLKELGHWPGEEAHVLVVDNDSQDGSFEKMTAGVEERGWTDRVTVLQSGMNGGFAYGNNAGIRWGLMRDDVPEYFYVLNPDAFPDKDAIKILVDFMDSRSDVGIAGSYIHGMDGVEHPTSFRFPTAMTELVDNVSVMHKVLPQFRILMPTPTEPQQVDWLAGASMIVRKEVFDDVGLMDETFFLYYEETDFCYRAKEAGWPTWYIPASQVSHVGSATTGMQDNERPMPSYWFESRRYYFKKHYGRAYLEAANAAWLTGTTFKRFKERVAKKMRYDKVHLFRDFLQHNYLGLLGPGGKKD